ncbi:unnamed protein product [Spirodela intermedia]|uniref:Small-subunit processome Utp12 domain-containing protein n=1 Tax=Spirodela intermedia TaxID=51605 RepID=A0A7I8J7J0_SPIIN|nr:unnamed protein product [Spirodela intermedia]CAA6666031.1 unnamed protein product [Spirodela intermedia]
MNFRFQNLLGAPYRGGNVVISENSLLSPVGNRVSATDLLKSETLTFPFESSSNIARIAVSPDGNFLLTIDEASRALFVNLRRRVVLHRISFKKTVSALKFSPDGAHIAIGVGKLLQIWRSPGFRKEFFPFQLERTFPDCDDAVTALDWSPDSSHLLAGSKDLTVRLFSLKRSKGSNKPVLFLGHRDRVVGVFFCVERKTNAVSRLYSISRDGAIFTWKLEANNDLLNSERHISDPPSPGTPEQEGSQAYMDRNVDHKRKKIDCVTFSLEGESEASLLGKWELLKKDFFMQSPAKLTACDYHRDLDMVVVGFSNGVFGLYQMPDFVCIHVLSISKEKITTAVFNKLGNWLTFGCAKLGQLLVWIPSSGSCFITFSEHTNAVTALHFVAGKDSLLSASLDGTIRAWDLIRYRNFRTFTTPSSRQFVSLASDQSGEVVCAGTLDSFEIFLWSMKTGRLLDVLSGHEGPVHGLMFSPTNNILTSSSWDKTVRLWDIYGKGAVETFTHNHDVLTVVYRPDGKQIGCSTLDGQIHFWDPVDGLLMSTIEGRRDIAGGRLMTDRDRQLTQVQESSLPHYATLLMEVLLRRFQVTHNLSLDGVLDFLNSKKMTDGGPLDLIDDDDSDIDEGVEKQTRKKLGYDLPGSLANRGRPVIRTKSLKIAPTGRCWAAATTEGVLIYSVDESFIFDPTDLDIDVTPEAVDEALAQNQHQIALLLSLRLNEDSLIKKCIISVSPSDIPAVASSIPHKYLQRLVKAFADLLESCPHLELILQWCQELCKVHGDFIQKNSHSLFTALKYLHKSITKLHQDLSDMCSSNEYLLRYLCSTSI